MRRHAVAHFAAALLSLGSIALLVETPPGVASAAEHQAPPNGRHGVYRDCRAPHFVVIVWYGFGDITARFTDGFGDHKSFHDDDIAWYYWPGSYDHYGRLTPWQVGVTRGGHGALWRAHADCWLHAEGVGSGYVEAQAAKQNG